MRRLSLVCVAVLCLLSLSVTGCASYDIADSLGDVASSYPAVENPFETDADAGFFAAIGHGLANNEIDEESGRHKPLVYHGGEMAVDYTVHADGKASNTGFLLFLNGIPQPYKIDGEMTYLVSLQLPGDNEDYPFTFRFTPVTGKEGETAVLTIVSVFYPDFKPDMDETSAYGNYHNILPYQCEVLMQAKPETADIPDTAPVISDLSYITQKATKTFLEEELPAFGYGAVTAEENPYGVCQVIAYNGKLVFDNLDVSDGVHITYKTYEPSGIAMETTFFIDHKPIATEDGKTVFRTETGKEDVAVIEFDIDAAALNEQSTFYAVSVPVGTSDSMAIKTLSILFYK